MTLSSFACAETVRFPAHTAIQVRVGMPSPEQQHLRDALALLQQANERADEAEAALQRVREFCTAVVRKAGHGTVQVSTLAILRILDGEQ